MTDLSCFNKFFRELIYGRKLLAQAYPSVVRSKAWTGHSNWHGVPLFNWNAFLTAGHVTQILERFHYLLRALVSLLFFVSGKSKCN